MNLVELYIEELPKIHAAENIRLASVAQLPHLQEADQRNRFDSWSDTIAPREKPKAKTSSEFAAIMAGFGVEFQPTSEAVKVE